MWTKALLIFLFSSYFLIQSFLFFLFSQFWVSYFPIFLSNHAAGHPGLLIKCGNPSSPLPFSRSLWCHAQAPWKIYRLSSTASWNSRSRQGKAWFRYKATSYNLGQNCLENCVLGEHFPKHPSCIDSSHSPSPWKQCCVFKKRLIPGRLQGAALNWGEGISFRKAVVLEIVLLRRIVYIMGKTFSSTFVRDCSLF